MNPDQLLDSSQKPEADKRIKVIGHILICYLMISLVYSCVSYYSFIPGDSWYIPKYTINYTYQENAFDNLFLSAGILAAYVPMIFRKYNITLIIASVACLLHLFSGFIYSILV